jgi:hypothetical protein
MVIEVIVRVKRVFGRAVNKVVLEDFGIQV